MLEHLLLFPCREPGCRFLLISRGLFRLPSRIVCLEQVVRAWGKWRRTVALEPHWLQADQWVWAMALLLKLLPKSRGHLTARLSQFKNKSQPDFWTVAVASWVFNQPSMCVKQSRDFQPVNTSVSSIGIWESSEKNATHTQWIYMPSFAVGCSVFY